jgi:STE24 endopeptidase
MTALTFVILVGVLLAFAVHRAADVLNLRRLSADLPPGFEDLYDAETYRRSQEYTATRLRFGMAVESAQLLLLVVFWLAGGFGWLDELVRGLGWGPVASGLVYVSALFLARTVLTLPLGAYSTFVIEERFGFNRTSPGTFVADRIKGLGLAILLGGPLLTLVLALFEYGGAFAWVFAWAAATIFTLLVQLILPTFILPLFNKYTPLEDGELRQAIFAYASKVGFELKDIYVMDGSRRSSKGNAFFTGLGRAKRIALFDTLVSRHPVEELVGVLAHEIGHFQKRHVLKGTILSVAQLGLTFALLALVLRSEAVFAAFGVDRPSTYVGIVIFAVLIAPLELLLSAGGQALSRAHEREADRFAAETTGRPASLAGALKRLSRDTLSNLTPHALYVALNYSHPPVPERVRALTPAQKGPASGADLAVEASGDAAL